VARNAEDLDSLDAGHALLDGSNRFASNLFLCGGAKFSRIRFHGS
jgi:hypothetical protein